MRIIRARCGLRGVRLGEASHPRATEVVSVGGPHQDVVRDTGDVDPTLMDALEVDLQETHVDLVDVTAQDSDSTESFVAVDSRSKVLSDDQERDGASVVVTLWKLMSPNRLRRLVFRIVKRWVWGCDVWMR